MNVPQSDPASALVLLGRNKTGGPARSSSKPRRSSCSAGSLASALRRA